MTTISTFWRPKLSLNTNLPFLSNFSLITTQNIKFYLKHVFQKKPALHHSTLLIQTIQFDYPHLHSSMIIYKLQFIIIAHREVDQEQGFREVERAHVQLDVGGNTSRKHGL